MPGKRAAVYWCLRASISPCFNDWLIGYWNCSDGVAFFAFQFLSIVVNMTGHCKSKENMIFVFRNCNSKICLHKKRKKFEWIVIFLNANPESHCTIIWWFCLFNFVNFLIFIYFLYFFILHIRWNTFTNFLAHLIQMFLSFVMTYRLSACLYNFPNWQQTLQEWFSDAILIRQKHRNHVQLLLIIVRNF